ncbi:DUF3024 domain-containing protein [Paracraurococcus lichenis]|uniref:DUF3024 domain-containing protein n=1 Tax=Paracraurococcus lichenis TaxID=3064888 RepID=A0ABT9DYD6_9PROT|nr:hypothetical protein [Paracraurococcus sp. LOR1-02]MDO9708903.1 hypothetical protein [Paracraurococcus sp. LOR1-02]
MASVLTLQSAAMAPMEAATPAPAPLPRRHPNGFDLRRIERVLSRRKRYRYVTPKIAATADGYRIESPCCSRSVDAEGGIIDVALLRHDDAAARWTLWRKDHAAGAWLAHSSWQDLNALLAWLNEDPGREFWQ